MSYRALYRKYRPLTFEEVAGQTQIVQTLKRIFGRIIFKTPKKRKSYILYI